MDKIELEVFREAIDDKGELLFEAEDYQYGILVIPCFAAALNIPLDRQICRVVQIRKEIGQFGSDLFLVRHTDGSLMVWENQSFFKVKEKYTSQIEAIYNQHDAIEIDDDEPGKSIGYNYPGNKEFIKGFIIPSPYPEGHMTPMKQVKEDILENIERLTTKNN